MHIKPKSGSRCTLWAFLSPPDGRTFFRCPSICRSSSYRVKCGKWTGEAENKEKKNVDRELTRTSQNYSRTRHKPVNEPPRSHETPSENKAVDMEGE